MHAAFALKEEGFETIMVNSNQETVSTDYDTSNNFISRRTEVDVDCIPNGEVSVIGAIMQHIEEAGIHSGDSAEGRPHVIDMIKNDEIDLIINTPRGKTPRKDEVKIRSTAVERRIPILTTISGVEASIRAMRSIKTKVLTVKSLQEYHL